MRLLRWFGDNILFILTLFLLVFIPLYPKKPLIDVINTWVYIRAEDFMVVLVLFVWLFLLLRKKITLRTPLTLPIIIFWIIGAVATIHGILLIFPNVANVFPNVAFLSFLRRIEYLSVFFVAYSGMKDKRFLPFVVATLVVTLLLIVAYGFGQKYLGFPAYLTMNEEFAKGEAIRLSALSRVPSTFGGHYDLAAYLVLILPILTSLVFGLKNLFVRLILLATIAGGFVLLFMTVSRVSFFVLLFALCIVLLFQKKRVILYVLPIIAFFAFLFITFSSTLLDRFTNTIRQVDVLVQAETGQAIGHVQTVPATYFADKIIKRKLVRTADQLGDAMIGADTVKEATPSETFPYWALPDEVNLLTAPNEPTGENLPQGTGYINLVLSPVTKRVGEFFYEPPSREATTAAEVLVINGNFIIKRAAAYDLSFTTRFQGEWPKAIESFKRNILFGSGYSSISLAVDNNYFRMLGEVGFLGFAAFIAMFIILGIYIKKILPDIESPMVRSFIIGFVAGLIGLALNAILIDVFEASKIAFTLWLLVGVTLGTLTLYQTKSIEVPFELRRVATSTYAIILYIGVTAALVFSPMVDNFFVGDDFTWFRWIAQSDGVFSIVRYFTESDGFFYRPGAKTYFLFMYSLFWLNQTVYHVVSIMLHFLVAVLVFLLARKILGSVLLSVLASFLFLILSGYSEAVFWISSTGFLFTALFSLTSLLLFTYWEEQRKTIFYVSTITALVFGFLFHELGIITPVLLIAYKLIKEGRLDFAKLLHFRYVLLFLPIPIYLLLRYISGSHWFSGDYSYNIIKLPFNVIGNTLGYFSLALFGPISSPFYQTIRGLLREHLILALLTSVIALFIIIVGYRFIAKKLSSQDKKILLFGFAFFIVPLLPFLGLGNIASRYSYIASLGFVIIFAFLIKKLYVYLQWYGRDIAMAGTIGLLSLFSLLHTMQVQQSHGDWHEAGEKTKRFFVSIDAYYANPWASAPMKFYFVNVPIRQGEAWVFPVGLSDALWFGFRNPEIRVYQLSTREQALGLMTGSDYERAFAFDESGRLTVIEKETKQDVQ